MTYITLHRKQFTQGFFFCDIKFHAEFMKKSNYLPWIFVNAKRIPSIKFEQNVVKKLQHFSLYQNTAAIRVWKCKIFCLHRKRVRLIFAFDEILFYVHCLLLPTRATHKYHSIV